MCMCSGNLLRLCRRWFYPAGSAAASHFSRVLTTLRYDGSVIRGMFALVAVLGCGRFGFEPICGFDGQGQAVCWGGVAVRGGTASPVVSPISGSSQLALGGGHMCGVMPGGAVQCVGINFAGQLGNGDNADQTTPVTVTGIAAATQVEAGQFTSCAIDAGNVRCWGVNSFGQLGDGTMMGRNTPTATVLANAAQVVVGLNTTCARRLDGTLACWGAGNDSQLGDGMSTSSTTPRNVSMTDIGTAQHISVGFLHTCAIGTGGKVWCWGFNDGAQLGDGTFTERPLPTAVLDAPPSLLVATGANHSCSIATDRTVWCWGDNLVGQLGDGTNDMRERAGRVLDLTDVVAITAGGYYTCAATSNGAAYCWGENGAGQLGDGMLPSHAIAQQSLVYCP